jgi:hypothetical protein
MKMKKILILTILFLSSLATFSQVKFLTKDTAFVDTTRGKGIFYKPKKKQSPFTAEFGLGSANIWRGVDVGKQTGVYLDAEYEPCKWTTFGIRSYVAANQYRPGFGNQIVTSAKVNVYNISLGVQDIYFENQILSSDTDYFVYDKSRTNHFFEATFNYKGDANTRLDFFSSMVFYQNQSYDRGAFFFQFNYHPTYNTEMFMGYVTGESQVNFQSKGGFTNVGITIKRYIEFSSKFAAKAKLTVSVNPSYKTIIQPNAGVSGRPLNTSLLLLF